MRNLWPSVDKLAVATDHQRERAALATASPVGILGGNPGAGKTFLSAQLIKSVVEEYGMGNVAVCAPTGKAGVRITEAMIGHGLHGLEAMTIHRLLGVERGGYDGKGWGFSHNKTNPLRTRFVFVDESSMCGVNISASLLEALLPGTHLMWIGDFAQLPPVEHGAPLRDMIDAGVPYGELTEVHRNGGDILIACKDLKEGRPFKPSPYINLEEGKNLLHRECSRPTLAVGAMANMLKNCPPGIDPMWDVQVLCAVNEHSDVARKPLNKLIQNILNPHGDRVEGNPFRMGDKIICTSNGVLPLVECTSCKSGPGSMNWNGKWYECGVCGRGVKPSDCMPEFVANGEIGKVVLLDKTLMHVAFDSPARTVRAAGDVMKDFTLAYAITTHKSQGSQWPVVICMADDSHGADRVTSWEWWRTALSRMEKLCVTIGKKGAIDRQCRKSALRERKTFLKEQLMRAVA